MTTTVRIVSDADGVFRAEHPYGGEALRQWDQVHCHGCEQAIRREQDGRGYLINEGPGIIRVRYEHVGNVIGPRTDYLLPGQCKELGIGRGVAWRLIETSGG